MNTQPRYFKTLRALTLGGVLGGIGLSLASAATIDINPIKDNTLYEYVPADGDRSNALGNRLTMPHGGTVSLTPFFGRRKAGTFPAR